MDADGATRVSDLEKLEAALATICSGGCAQFAEPEEGKLVLAMLLLYIWEFMQSDAGNGMQEMQQVRYALGRNGYQ